MALFKKRSKELNVDDYVEMPVEIEEKSGHVKIIIEKLENYAAVDRIIKRLREGSVVILRVKDLKDSNLDELKHVVSKLRTVCNSIDGDIVGVGDEWIILTPANARVER